MKSSEEELKPLVIYDGRCALCSRAIQFILKNEKNNDLNFTTLDSAVSIELIRSVYDIQVPDSILFYRDGILVSESRAAFAILKYLKKPYSFLGLFRILPLFMTDPFYRWVARNRYTWFGKTKEKCWLMLPDQSHRFK